LNHHNQAVFVSAKAGNGTGEVTVDDRDGSVPGPGVKSEMPLRPTRAVDSLGVGTGFTSSMTKGWNAGERDQLAAPRAGTLAEGSGCVTAKECSGEVEDLGEAG
jgi:hypothetical protein